MFLRVYYYMPADSNLEVTGLVSFLMHRVTVHSDNSKGQFRVSTIAA